MLGCLPDNVKLVTGTHFSLCLNLILYFSEVARPGSDCTEEETEK